MYFALLHSCILVSVWVLVFLSFHRFAIFLNNFHSGAHYTPKHCEWTNYLLLFPRTNGLCLANMKKGGEQSSGTRNGTNCRKYAKFIRNLWNMNSSLFVDKMSKNNISPWVITTIIAQFPETNGKIRLKMKWRKREKKLCLLLSIEHFIVCFGANSIRICFCLKLDSVLCECKMTFTCLIYTTHGTETETKWNFVPSRMEYYFVVFFLHLLLLLLSFVLHNNRENIQSENSWFKPDGEMANSKMYKTDQKSLILWSPILL